MALEIPEPLFEPPDFGWLDITQLPTNPNISLHSYPPPEAASIPSFAHSSNALALEFGFPPVEDEDIFHSPRIFPGFSSMPIGWPIHTASAFVAEPLPLPLYSPPPPSSLSIPTFLELVPTLFPHGNSPSTNSTMSTPPPFMSARTVNSFTPLQFCKGTCRTPRPLQNYLPSKYS